MIPKTQKPFRYIRKIKCRVHFPTLTKAILWYNKRTHDGKPLLFRKTIFGRGGDGGEYPAVSIRNEKIMVHVLLMMYRLKGNVPEDMYVHHVNEDKTDARRGNLALMDISQHQRHHNLGKDCARWRGRKLNYADGFQVALPVPTVDMVVSQPERMKVPF